MYGLVIIEEYESGTENSDSYTTLRFSNDLNKIADYWINFMNFELVDKLRESILNESFWYTHYQRGTTYYTFRVFKVEEEVEINVN